MTDLPGAALTPDMTQFDQYLDALARRGQGGPDPLPTPPVELTTFALQAQAMADADRVRPAFGDELFRRMLAAQQEQKSMDAQAVLSPAAIPTLTIQIEIEERRRSPITWAALAAVIALAFVGATWWNNHESNDRAPLVIAPSTTVATPTLGEEPQSGSAEELWRVSDVNGMDIRPIGLGVAPDGNIWIANGNGSFFAIFSSDGTFLESWSVTGQALGHFNWERDPNDSAGDATDIAWAADGSIYVLDTGNFQVRKYSADRTFLFAFGSQGAGKGEFVSMYSLAVGPDGNVYVLDDIRGVIQVFDDEGNFVQEAAADLNGPGVLHKPGGIAIDAEGNIWVADWGNHRVATYDPTGAFRYSFGMSSSLPGGFVEPYDLAIDASGRVVVADKGNGRVQILRVDGSPLFSWETNGLPVAVDTGTDGVVYVITEGADLEAWRVIVPDAPIPDTGPLGVVYATPVATPAQD